jgi:hypothetical protein
MALLAYNVPQIRFSLGLRSLVASILAAFLLLGLGQLIFRDHHRSALACLAALLLFFSYGHAADLIHERWGVPHLAALMLTLWAVLAGVAIAWARRTRTRVREAAPALNLVSLGLMAVSTAQAIWWSVPGRADGPVVDHAPWQDLSAVDGQLLPDIYYIIVDSYGRSDLLRTSFDLDNRGFISALEDMGFYVADWAQSNYNRTEVSLASSLNLDYLQNLDDEYRPGSISRRTLWASISHSTARFQLESLGYETVAFATGFAWSEIVDSDLYLSPSPLWSTLTAFETLLARTTPLRHLEDLGWVNLDEIDGRRYHERTQLALSGMVDLARMAGPKFVFIHIIPPHPPFIYAADGDRTDPAAFLNQDRRYTYASYTLGYRSQVEYISGRLQAALSELLEAAESPPIIVLQGDHAPWLQKGAGRFMILNAYLLPGHADLPYPAISPVNTFRLIFNAYFGAHYDILPDVSYYSPTPNIYEFQEVPNPCLEQ